MLPVKRQAASGNADKAAAALEQARLEEQERNRLLYHLEAGLLYHLAGEHSKSNAFLESAEWISDEMYTRRVSQEAAALLTSDNLLPYRGEYYDYLFINYYKLLNYLHLGLPESALVEVRRINYKMSLFRKEDAFLHWLTAVLHRHLGQESSAFIEYMKAYRAYEKKYPETYGVSMPAGLIRDISVFCLESRTGRCAEFPQGVTGSYRPPAGYGSALFILETGFAPHKYEKRIEAAIPQRYRKDKEDASEESYYLTVAVPEYAPREGAVNRVRLVINGSAGELELAEDIGSMAVHYLNRERAAVIVKAAARAAAKYAAYRTARGDDGGNLLRRLLGSAVDIIGSATERADTRSWLLLPDRIFMSKEYLKPGDYEFELHIEVSGVTESVIREEFSVEEGELKFILLRRF